MFNSINLKKLITSILIPLIVGILSAVITNGSMDVYGMIKTPPLAPPSILFPIVWTILFVLMGISLYIIRMQRCDEKTKKEAYFIFGAQLLFNFLWSIFFFVVQAYTFSAIWLVLMIVLIISMIVKFLKINQIAGYIQIPYLIWCIFALYLNIAIAILN